MTKTEGFEHFKLNSGKELFYIDDAAVSRNLKERGYKDSEELQCIEHSDLQQGVYEGGLKVWEGASDLCNFIDTYSDEAVCAGKSVLEVGCGAALPTILALQKGAKNAVVQDFNKSVIECFTKDNFGLNNVPMNKCKFYFGDWKNFQEELAGHRFDIIFSSETIYNEQLYERFHGLLDAALKPNGMILIAAKSYYFGVGGSVPSFISFVKDKGKFNPLIVWSSNSTIPRKIIQLTRNNLSDDLFAPSN
uniref:protein-histidine N-methyltransferase n=1 Tax=Syphacia muris TaxID=451379 RepID=A0A0N5AGY0_9BILA